MAPSDSTVPPTRDKLVSRIKDYAPLWCNKCHRTMKGSTPYDGACGCGGLIEIAILGDHAMIREEAIDRERGPTGSQPR